MTESFVINAIGQNPGSSEKGVFAAPETMRKKHGTKKADVLAGVSMYLEAKTAQMEPQTRSSEDTVDISKQGKQLAARSDKEGKSIKADFASEEETDIDTTKQQIERLKKQIEKLTKEIQELQASNLSQEEKNAQVQLKMNELQMLNSQLMDLIDPKKGR